MFAKLKQTIVIIIEWILSKIDKSIMDSMPKISSNQTLSILSSHVLIILQKIFAFEIIKNNIVTYFDYV